MSRPASAEGRFDVVTMGRVGIDLYPATEGVPLAEVEQFTRYLGGSPTNVAVGTRRLGHRSAVITRTGDDPFAPFVRNELEQLGVSSRYVLAAEGARTTLAFCELFPPDRFPLYFVRDAPPPELAIAPDDLDLDVIADAGVFWSTLTGLSGEPSRGAHLAAWGSRRGGRNTVLDLDLRPSYWNTLDDARDAGLEALAYVDVVVGNIDECAVVLGDHDPARAASALLDHGVRLAIVKRGPHGVLAATRERMVDVPAFPTRVVNGLGAGDAFGAGLCHGLLSGMDLDETIAFASAAGAIVAARHECARAMPAEDAVRAVLAGEEPHVVARSMTTGHS